MTNQHNEEDIIEDEIVDETTTATARRGAAGGRSIGDHSSVASGLSDDNRSVSSQLSVWQQTKMILMGQNPNDVINEEGSDVDDNTNHNRSSVPKSLSIVSNTPIDKSSSHLDRNRRQRSSCRLLKSDEYSDDEIDEIDFTQDPLSEMTLSRRLALFLMKRYSWYNPALKKVRQEKTQQSEQHQQHQQQQQGSQLLNRYQKVHGGKYGKSMDDNDDDNDNNMNGKKNGDVVPDRGIRTTVSTESGALYQILSNENKKEVLLNDAYPFTCSTPETPSLERAWAYFEHVALPRYIVEKEEEQFEQDQQEQQQQANGVGGGDNTNGITSTAAATTTTTVPKKKKKNILHRCIRKCFCKGNKQLQRAEPGEKHFDTALYQPIFTPHKQLGDFGLGVGLYFSTLRAITVITLLAGILNIPNFMYFSSTQYNDPNSNPIDVGNFTQQAKLLVKGSAICVDTTWVYCEDCINNTKIIPKSRLMNATNTVTGEKGYFALKNNCVGTTIEQAMISYATLLFLLLSTIALNVYLNRMEIAFDEDEQTAQDYSIMIDNPPEDATDPQEWHNFFKEAFGAHVTACTIAVDNDLLVRTLVSRRELLRRIELMVEPGTSLDTLTIARVAAQQERQRRVFGYLMAMIIPGIPEFFSKLTVMNAKVQGLAQQHYPATKVFITFETEKSQREVLMAYNLGSIDISRNNSSKLSNPEKQLFRGNLVLKINEPDEPNTVRWKDLNEKFKERIKQQILTGVATIGAIVTIAFIVGIVNDNDFSANATAYTIAVFNVVFPLFAKILTSMEAHASEGDIQRSLYFKIALFRWVNTAVVITIITPFTSTLSSDKLIPQISALFFADIVTTNAIQFLDPVGHIQRHILAPRAKTQDAMNLAFQGSVIELAERYTAMTKLYVFLQCYRQFGFFFRRLGHESVSHSFCISSSINYIDCSWQCGIVQSIQLHCFYVPLHCL
jgi:Calcium-activated chloride channel